MVNGFKCKECDFVEKTINGLSTHKRMTHQKVNANKPKKENSITMEEFTVKYNLNEVDQGKVENIVDESIPTTSSGFEMTANPKLKAIQSENIKAEPPRKSNVDDKKMKRKAKNTDFSCKYCSQNFSKITLSTSHLKLCNTKTEEIQGGNAITINSPLVTVKHFFCHCSICGSGYDAYTDLSAHEYEKNNHKCSKCDKCFMVESELNNRLFNDHSLIITDERSQEIKCEECALIVKNEDDMAQHIETVHKDSSKTGEEVKEAVLSMEKNEQGSLDSQ